MRPQPGRASLGRRSLEAEPADTQDGGPRGDEPERSDDARPRRRLHKRGEEATAPGPLPVWASRASGLRFFSYSTACYVSNLEFLVIRARSVAFLSSDCVERSDQRREVVTFRGRRRADRTRSGPCRVPIDPDRECRTVARRIALGHHLGLCRPSDGLVLTSGRQNASPSVAPPAS